MYFIACGHQWRRRWQRRQRRIKCINFVCTPPTHQCYDELRRTNREMRLEFPYRNSRIESHERNSINWLIVLSTACIENAFSDGIESDKLPIIPFDACHLIKFFCRRCRHHCSILIALNVNVTAIYGERTSNANVNLLQTIILIMVGICNETDKLDSMRIYFSIKLQLNLDWTTPITNQMQTQKPIALFLIMPFNWTHQNILPT